MVNSQPTIPVIILNVNGLSSSVKKQRLSDWMGQQVSTTWCLHRTLCSSQDTGRLKVKGMGKDNHVCANERKPVCLSLSSYQTKWTLEQSLCSGERVLFNRKA